MELIELENLIKTRRSIRRWQDKEVPEELLVKAVELATWAPNGGNQQNWHFYIITNRNTIKSIADAVTISSEKMSSWPEAKKFPDAARWPLTAGFFRLAPAAIAVAAARYQSVQDQLLVARESADPEAAKIREWRNLANSRIQSVASAVSLLTLVLHQMGIGSVWMTGPMQAKEQIEKLLCVPQGLDLVAFIPVGYPAETPTKERIPVQRVSEVIK